MQKKGAGRIFSSKDGRLGLPLLVSIILIFALTIVFVEAMTVTLRTPGDLTYNTTTNRNINITFNATWFLGGGAVSPHENVSSCTLWVNSTTNQIGWSEAKFVNISKNATQPDDLIINGSNVVGLSYMNYTFTADGNYTFAVGCFNATNSSAFGGNYNHTNVTWSSNFSIFVDITPPSFNFSELNVSIYNTSVVAQRVIEFKLNDSGLGLNMSSNNSINLSLFLGGTRVLFLSYLNSSGSTNLSCTATSSAVTKAIVTCNATYNFNSNGSYLINASAQDALNSYNSSSVTLVVDQIPPALLQINLTNSSHFNGASVVTVINGTGSLRQGQVLYLSTNLTDNLTQPLNISLEWLNTTSGSDVWKQVDVQLVNATSPGNSGAREYYWGNASFTIPTGRNEFEGRNVSFRAVYSDTLGNSNYSVTQIVQINDTYKPILSVSSVAGQTHVNGTNTTDTTPTIVWNVTENNKLNYVAVQFDSLTDTECNQKKNFTTTVELNRNGSLTLLDSSGCAGLLNGTHTVRLTAEDTWGNSELYIHSFVVQTGTPTISLSSLGNGLSAVNKSNVTISTGINFTAVAGSSAGVLKTFTWTSSCNASTQTISNSVSDFTVANLSFIYPFQNISSCANREANQTVTVTVADAAGNTQTAHYQFLVDGLGPSLSVNSPVDRSNNTNNVTISLSAMDGSQAISMFGYYLDRKMDVGTLTTLNISDVGVIGFAGVNNTNIFKLNFTPGTHTVKFTVNDTLGNAKNSSIITFDVRGLIDLNILGFNVTNKTGTGLAQYSYANAANITGVNLTNASSGNTVENLLNVSGRTLNLFMVLSNTTKGINLTIQFNESAAVWDQYNFTVQTNDSTTLNFLTSNWTTEVMNFVMVNETIQNFLPDNESYFVSVNYPVNASMARIGGEFEIWYFDDVKEFSGSSSKTNVTQCAAGFNPSFTFTSSSSCWNNTDNISIKVFLPHFSALAFVNNSGGTPNVNVTTPGGNTSNSRVSNQTVSSFIPNITVSADAVSCYYYLNATTPTNKTMTKSGNICLGSTENVKNLNVVNGYNITFWVIDDDSNTNRYTWGFNMSDTTVPNNGIITSSPGETTAAVTITGTNETVNATVNYGTANTTLSSSAVQTDFNETQVVSITGLTASTTYYYNVTVCDYNGNCKTNVSTFSFTTSAAAAAAAAATTTASSSGGGGVAAPTSTVSASTSRSWDALAADSTGTFKVSSDNIAFTNIAIAVANAVSSPSVGVSSLTSNPQSSAPSDKVYQYLEVTHTNIADSDISKATVSFKVPKSWLTANGVVEGDVALYRYNSGQWNVLPTTIISSDADNVWFEAVSPGFSDYAIGSKTGAIAPTTTPEQPAAETTTPATTTPEQPAGTTQPPVESKPVSKNTLAWIVVAIIVVLAAVGFVVWKKKTQQ